MAKRDPLDIVGQHVMRPPRAVRSQSYTEHGWITRYDERFDQYTLFVPHKGADLLLRGDIVQSMSTEELVLCRDDQDAFPPPLEDYASRYVGVPMVRDRDGMAGRVVCFLPFAGLYKVAYPDFSSHEVTENEIINSMIHVVTTAQASLDEERQRKRVKVDSHAEVVNLSQSTRTNRRGSSESNSRSSSSSRSIGRSSSSRAMSSTASSHVASVASVSPPIAPVVGSPVRQETHEEEVDPPTAPILEPAGDVSVAETEASMASPIAVSSEDTTDAADVSMAVDVDGDDEDDDFDEDLPPDQGSRTFTNTSPAFYILDKPLHEALKPFERRSLAYECLRNELLNVLDRQEAGASKPEMQYDVLKNPDIKDRDSIRRFIDAKGLVVVNALITIYMDEERPRHDNLLHMIKILAMMPPPTERQVVESSIGKTIGRLTKVRSPDSTTGPLPKSITHLARWIKAKWIQTIKRDPNLGKHVAAKPKLKKQRRSNIAKRDKKLQEQRDAALPEGYYHDEAPIPRIQRRAAPSPTPTVLDLTTTHSQSSTRPQITMGAARKSTLKPDRMHRTENLSRTRFTVNTDSKAESDHHKRDHDSRAGFRLPTSGGVCENENDSASGGNRGVYGRSQRLTFGDQWSVCEFFRDTAPSLIHPDISKLPKNRQIGSLAPPRPILRKKSKYTSSMDSFVDVL